VKEKIIEVLKTIEKMDKVTIIFACESGSRAWGFGSPDSDYDVRFIYIRRPQDYFTVFPYRDVIDRNKGNHETSELIRDCEKIDIDVVGFDLQKVMKLVSGSNPGIHEWLSSYQIYIEQSLVWTPIKQLSQDMFKKQAAFNHYLNLAFGHFHKYIQKKDEVILKKYLYIMRSLLSCQYINEYEQYPPADISEIYSNPRLQSDSDVIDFLKIAENLSVKKQHNKEDFTIPADNELNMWMSSRIAYYEAKAEQCEKVNFSEAMYARIDEMFYDIVCTDKYGQIKPAGD